MFSQLLLFFSITKKYSICKGLFILPNQAVQIATWSFMTTCEGTFVL